MKVSLQTRFNSPTVVYDTDAPASAGGSGAGKFIMNLLKPYAKIQEGNYTLYELNKPYPDESGKWQFFFGLSGALILVGGASLLFGLGRISKK